MAARVRQPARSHGDHRQRLRDEGEIVLSRGGQDDAVRPTLEEHRAEPALERDDAVADRARREVQLIGREPEALQPASGLEEAQGGKRRKLQGHCEATSIGRDVGEWLS